MSSTVKLARKFRARRHEYQFRSALRNASPSMAQELLAAGRYYGLDGMLRPVWQQWARASSSRLARLLVRVS